MLARFEAWVEAERGRFLLWLPVLMAAGVVFYDALPVEPPIWLAPTILAAAGFATWAGRGHSGFRAPALMLAALALGVTSASMSAWRASPLLDLPRKATIVTGQVAAVEQLPNGRRITLTAARLDAGPALPRRLRIRLKRGDEIAIGVGDLVELRALLQPPAPPAYPGAWDLQRDAYFSGHGGGGTALGPVTLRAKASPAGAAMLLQSLREAINGRVRAVLPGAEGAIAATLLTGATSSIPEADRAAFRDSGLAHLLAIAGLHIGIVMGLLFGATRGGLAWSERAALYWPLKTIAGGAALVAGFAYLLLTGAHVPIIRSFAMACLVTLALLAGRRAASLRGLALAMVALVLLAPAEVLGVSFQMSFSAVLALIFGYELMRPMLQRLRGDGSRWRRIASHIAALALTSALAGTASAPYGAYHFGHIQLYYVEANMIAVPITALWVMPAGLIALALMPVHLEFLALVPMGWGVSAILWIAHAVASWPAAVLAVPHIPPWGLAIFSLGLAWFGLWRSRLRQLGWLAMALGLVAPAFIQPPDILVSADARLIGVRQAGVVRMQQTAGGSRFTRDAWLQFWAAAIAIPMPACTPDGCLLPGNARLVPENIDANACTASLLVSAAPIRLNCTPAIPTIDRFTVWRNGAHAVWLDPAGPIIISDRAYRGDRPWVPGIPTKGRLPAGPAMPVAATDD